VKAFAHLDIQQTTILYIRDDQLVARGPNAAREVILWARCEISVMWMICSLWHILSNEPSSVIRDLNTVLIPYEI
jgi:hypothetical protein